MVNNVKRKLAFGVLIWFVLLLIYLPIFVLVIFSFSESRAMGTGSFDFGFGAWSDLFASRDIWTAVGNTFLIATISASLAVLIGTMASVGIARMRRRTRGLLEEGVQLGAEDKHDAEDVQVEREHEEHAKDRVGVVGREERHVEREDR